jgi:hypothetical protein
VFYGISYLCVINHSEYEEGAPKKLKKEVKMLVKFTVKSITGYKLNGSTQSLVFNSEHMFDWEDYGTDSRFRYILNPWDRRERAMLVTVDESISSKYSAANTAWGDKIVNLPVVTEVDGDHTHMCIPVRSITWAEAVADETDHCYVKYCEGGFKVREVMVPFSLNDIVAVGSTGSSSS